MGRYTTKREAETVFRLDILPDTPKDQNARYQAWFVFTKQLVTAGMISDSQYERWEVPRICNAYWR